MGIYWIHDLCATASFTYVVVGKISHTLTSNYQIQIEYDGRTLLTGATSYTQAEKELIDMLRFYDSTKGYIWPQTTLAYKYFHNHRKGDYMEFIREKGKYIIGSPVSI